MIRSTIVIATLLLPSLVLADQGGFTNAGGSASGGQGATITSVTSNPSGSLSLYCAPAATGCSGGYYNWTSTDGTTSINAAFSSGTDTESCSGGGKGGHITCTYSFIGNFSGIATVNGQTEAISGSTSQYFVSDGTNLSGYNGWNSAYAPFYYTDSEQILRSDDLMGTNQVAYGSSGSGVGQFGYVSTLTLDSKGRIYFWDNLNCRLVRIDDISGGNWITYGGTCGSGQGQFSNPQGMTTDGSDRLYIMDTGNNRLVRIDDMTGTNWTEFNNPSLVASYTNIALDAAGRIYVADSGNNRIVRMDDMTGANWVSLSQSPPTGPYIYLLQNPVGVAVDAQGRIYIAEDTSYQPEVIRIDDMTGTNWTSYGLAPGSLPFNNITLDASGAVFLGGYGVRVINDMYSLLQSSGTVGPIGTYYIFGTTPATLPHPLPSAVRLSAASLSFSQNAGTSGDTQAVSVSNFGGSPLTISGIATTGAFTQTNNCPASLSGGASCTVSVSFAPATTGTSTGRLIVSDSAGNQVSPQTVALTGLGTSPVASVSPTSLSFLGQVLGTASKAKKITLSNTGNGPLEIASIVSSPQYLQTNTCGSEVAPGGSCTISVSFSPTSLGAVSGALTIADNAGTQTVSLSGTGSAPVTLSASTLNFGRVPVGTTSAAKTLTLTNHEPVALNLAGLIATAPFAVSSTTCGTSVAAGGRCSISLTFSPTASGAVSGTLTISDDALTSPQTVSLSGTGR